MVQQSGMTQEELLAQLKTRGFESGGGPRTPLRDFWGTLNADHGITGTMEKRGNAPEPRLYIIYTFDDVEVIKSTETYTAPTAQIEIPHSNRDQSGMGVFGASVDRLINVDGNGEPLPDYDTTEDGEILKDLDGRPLPNPNLKDQAYLLGKRLHMVYTGGHMMWDGGQRKQVAREAWELTEIAGEVPATAAKAKTPAKSASKKSPMERAMEILDGKTEQAFYQAVFSDPVCKTDGKMITTITQRKFLPPLVESGIVVKDDDGIYHVMTQ